MLGWKSVKKDIRGIKFQNIRDRILSYGFKEADVTTTSTIFKKEGSSLSTDIEEIPLKIYLSDLGDRVQLRIKYDCFCLFDTGDLVRETEKIYNLILSKDENKPREDSVS